ncbi:hypothetical protein ACFXPX_32760 [Kitasatospora sp. NPDC059146]|uniref:hypothetical protein n=1 Tax=unclassified Kitasatospora TaxID=2633591 RepID=UPI00367E94B4
MTTTAAARRPITELPASPSAIGLTYQLETPLRSHAHDRTIERWTVSARIGEHFGLEPTPACAACVDRRAGVQQASAATADDDGCPHRLLVGEFVFYRIRWGAGMNPFWAMEEETQGLYEIAEAIFNEERNDYSKEFTDLADMVIGGSDLLVLDHAELTGPWRGFGLGPILAAEAIDRLNGGCGAVLLHPAPITTDDLTFDQFKHASKRLEETWAKVGFVPFLTSPYLVFGTCWGIPEQRLAALRKELDALCAQWQAARRTRP